MGRHVGVVEGFAYLRRRRVLKSLGSYTLTVGFGLSYFNENLDQLVGFVNAVYVL